MIGNTSNTVYGLKRQEMLNLEHGSMSVTEYEHHFVLLSTFVDDLHLIDNILAKMFEDYVSQHIRDKILVQILKKFRDMVKLALIAKRNQTKGHKSRKTYSLMRVQIEEHIKDKKSTTDQGIIQRLRGIKRERSNSKREEI